MLAKLLMALTMGLTMLVAEVTIPQPVTKPLPKIRKPSGKALPKHAVTHEQLTKKSPHAGYQVTVQWVKEFGASGKVNLFIGFQPWKDGYGLMYGTVRGKKYLPKIARNYYDIEYRFSFLDRNGKVKWEVQYIPDKIRYATDFVMDKTGKIYVTGWGGKRMDVWYVEVFDRNFPRGKQVARLLKKESLPLLILSRGDKLAVVGGYFIEAPKRALVVWEIDKRTKKSRVRETTRYGEIFLKRDEMLRFFAPFLHKESKEGGVYIINPFGNQNNVTKLSPSFLVEHDYGDGHSDIVEVEDDVAICEPDAVVRCDPRCRVTKWRAKLPESFSRKLTHDGRSIVYAQEDGNMGALDASNGKILWRVPLSESDAYRTNYALSVMKKGPHAHEYLRIGYRGAFNIYDFQDRSSSGVEATIVILDVKVEKAAH